MATRSVDATTAVNASDVVTRDLDGAVSNTYKVEVAVFPVPPFVELTLPVVLMYAPVEAALTVAVIVQLPLGETDPPVNIMTLPPNVPVIVPPHCGEVTFAESVIPPGNVSVKATPLKAVARFEFVIVNVRVDVPPATIGFGVNDFEMDAGARTVTVSAPVLFASFASVMTLFGSTVAVFTRLPAEAGVTVKL